MDAKALEILIERARNARDSAATRAAQHHKLAERARASLAQLQRYAGDYGRRASDQRGRGLDIAAELNQRAFDGRLQHAIRSQAEEAERCARTAQESAEEQARCERRLRSLEKLVQRQAATALALANKREQKFNDDLASRATAAFATKEA